MYTGHFKHLYSMGHQLSWHKWQSKLALFVKQIALFSPSISPSLHLGFHFPPPPLSPPPPPCAIFDTDTHTHTWPPNYSRLPVNESPANPTDNNALLVSFQRSSDAEILLPSTDWAYQIWRGWAEPSLEVRKNLTWCFISQKNVANKKCLN